jgi:hypothetical protein
MFLSITDVSHPYRTRGKIIALDSLIFTFIVLITKIILYGISITAVGNRTGSLV